MIMIFDRVAPSMKRKGEDAETAEERDVVRRDEASKFLEE
jgi:hypothetical protein